jgi:hypothetical protein
MGGQPPIDPMAMDPAAMGGAPAGGPMPADVGALGAPEGEQPPMTVGDMTQDDLKMMIADTINEVLQGGGEAPPAEEPIEDIPLEEPAAVDPLAAEAGDAEPTPADNAARLDAIEDMVAQALGGAGVIPPDAPQQAAPAEIPQSPIGIPMEDPMAKIAAEEEAENQKLLKFLKDLNCEV